MSTMELMSNPPIVFKAVSPIVWDIHSLQRDLGPEVCRLLLFAQAMNGCDITSRLFGIGKGAALRKLNSAPIFKQMAEVFCGKESCGDIVSAGEMSLSSLYGPHTGEGMDALRYRRFYETVSRSSTTVPLHILPPTSAAASYHSARVCLQVQQWMRARRRYEPRRLRLATSAELAEWQTYHQHQRFCWRSSDITVETIVTHEGVLVRNMDWNAQLSVVNATVLAAWIRPCCPHLYIGCWRHSLNESRVSNGEVCIPMCILTVGPTCKLSVLAYMPNVINSEFVIDCDGEFANNNY